MKFVIKKLAPEMADDYTDLFDNRGFNDGNMNKGCYCVWHHWTAQHEDKRRQLSVNERLFAKRNYAIKLIQEGMLNGFAAYLDGRMVGFCNADFKEKYYRLSRNNRPDSWVGLNDDDKVLSIVCYVVDVGLRGKDVATALLERVCTYAAENQFDYIEAYPALGSFDSTHCGGPFSMYEKLGFSLVDDKAAEATARKKLR
jgi:GNAT superfamily N-acetyltransferase